MKGKVAWVWARFCGRNTTNTGSPSFAKPAANVRHANAHVCLLPSLEFYA